MTTYKIGSSFPFAVAIVGGVISFAGLLLLANLFLVGIVAMAIGAFFWSSTYGLQINDETQEFREYRSEEHTSELQSRPHLVCRILLEKKKKRQTNHTV